MAIDLVKVRARIVLGGQGAGLTVETPYIQSFNVRKSRGQSSSFDASLKVEQDKLTDSNIGGEVVIYAGTKGSMNKIFTGVVKKASIAPCWGDPGFVFFNISGTDIMYLLQNKKFTRRCRATKGVWVSIDSVVRDGLRDGKFAYDIDTVTMDPGDEYTKRFRNKTIDEIGKNAARPPSSEHVISPISKITLKPNTDNP